MSINYPPSRNDPTKFPVYRVAFATGDFTPEQRAWIGLGVFSMCALGVTFLWHAKPNEADAVFAHWPEDNSTRAEDSTRYTGACRDAGRFTRSMYAGVPSVIELAPAGLAGSLQWQEAAAHECGHFLSLGHLPEERHGPAIMNETLMGVEFNDDLSARESMHGTTPPAGPTRADFAEFDRVHTLGLLPVPRS